MTDSNLPYLFSGGSSDITPKERIPLAGFASRSEPFSNVADPLEINAIVLRKGNAKVVFVSADLLYVGSEIRSEVLRRCRGSLKDEELFISSSHSHYAPATDPSKPLLGRAVNEYVAFVADKTARLIEEVLVKEPKPVRVSYSVGENPQCSMNRRKYGKTRSETNNTKERRMLMLPNADGFKDSKVRVLKFVDGAGSVVAMSWNYGCHLSAYHDSSSVSSDYPGAVRSLLRTTSGNRMPVVFWQGFSGDVNPSAFAKRPGVLSHSFAWYVRFRLANGKSFGSFTAEEWKKWVASIGDSVLAASNSDGARTLDGSIVVKRKAIPLESLGFESKDELAIHEVMIDGVAIIGFSAEPVAGYVPVLAGIFAGKEVIPVGCLDKTTLYLPTKAMLAEGGYEVEEFAKWFGIRGRYTPDIQERIEETLRSL